MVEKIYILKEELYDYFGGQKCSFEEFPSLTEAFKEYKRIRQLQFFYDDGGYYKVYPPKKLWRYSADKQRYHAREKWQWEEKREEETLLEQLLEELEDEPILI